MAGSKVKVKVTSTISKFDRTGFLIFVLVFFCHMTLNLEENVSCKNLILFETKLLRRQRLVSYARRNVRHYSTIKDWKSPLKGSRPSVPHGTNFFKPNRTKLLGQPVLQGEASTTWRLGLIAAPMPDKPDNSYYAECRRHEQSASNSCVMCSFVKELSTSWESEAALIGSQLRKLCWC